MALELPDRSGVCSSAGAPAGMASLAARFEVEHAVLRATPPVLAADGV